MWSWGLGNTNNATELDRLRKIKRKYDHLQSMMASGMQIKLDCPGPVKRTRIQLTIPDCCELFAKPDFQIFSPHKELFGLEWKLEAFSHTTQECKGLLGLFLHADPHPTFTWRPYSIEVTNRFHLLNKLCQYDILMCDNPRFMNDDSGWGSLEFEKLKVLLDPANGFLTPNGSILAEVEFMIKSMTLSQSHQNGEKRENDELKKLHKIEQKFEWLRSLVASGIEIKMLRIPSESAKVCRIGITIPDFAKWVCKPEFHIFSASINLLCFEWKLSAEKNASLDRKEWFCLALHANLPANFTGPFSIEVEYCLRILNKSQRNDVKLRWDGICDNNKDLGNFRMAEFEDLLDPEKGFIQDGCIRAEVVFGIISATLDHMLDENVCL